MNKRPPMPATLEDLAQATRLPLDVVQRLARFVQTSMGTHAFREVVDPALELLGGVVPRWPDLDEWNRWCFDEGMSFFVWHPHRRGLDDRQRLEILMHTVMMLAAKERNIADYRAASITDAEIVMAGDDCPICEEHRHHVVALAHPVMADLPPYHPGCRCGTLPRLD
jgi:hypothetical protein